MPLNVPSPTPDFPQRPLANTWWVLPGRFLAGEYPGAPTDSAARHKLGLLLDDGFDTFVDLTHPADRLTPYATLLQDLAATRNRPVHYVHIPVPDVGVPSVGDMRRALDVVDRALAADRRVYLHCWGGIGRTGTAVGCWLVRHGATAEAALGRVHQLYQAMEKRDRRPTAPETDEQRAFVRGWASQDPGYAGEAGETVARAHTREAGQGAIAAALGDLIIGEPKHWGPLAMVPLLMPGSHRRSPVAHRLLGDAIAEGTFRITEVSDQGSVPTLAARNDGDLPVLLIDGEELIGAKQNRIVNLSILVPAQVVLPIPVSCVEQGRWSARSAAFADAGRTMFARARARKTMDVSASMMRDGSRQADQGAIWSDVAERLEESGVASPTSAMADAFERHDAALRASVEDLAAVDGQVGAVFCLAGDPVALELFASADALAATLPKLVQSFALEVASASETVSFAVAPDDVAVFMSAIAATPSNCYPAIGLGFDLRFAAGPIGGGALVLDDAPVHLFAHRLAAIERAREVLRVRG